MILISDNDWPRCKHLNGFLFFNINFLMFMGGDIEH
jgi:hypothetical protein